MVTSTILMGLAVVFSGYLMIQVEAKTGIMSDLSPLIVGNVAGMYNFLVYNLFLHKCEGSGTFSSYKPYQSCLRARTVLGDTL